VYRTVVIGAGNTNFAVPKAIPKLMKDMVKEYGEDIEEAGSKGELDPFYLAAKYPNEFVQIHPFEDGAGRVSRLILNA
jgi:Fic family protein